MFDIGTWQWLDMDHIDDWIYWTMNSVTEYTSIQCHFVICCVTHACWPCHHRLISRLWALITESVLSACRPNIYHFVVVWSENAAHNSLVVFVHHCWRLVIVDTRGCQWFMLDFTWQWMPLQHFSDSKILVFRHHITAFNLWALFVMFKWETLIGKEWNLHSSVFKSAVMKCC